MDFRIRKNHRLKGYDYGHTGYYYVTVCVRNMKCLLCEIELNDSIAQNSIAKVQPTAIGQIVTECFFNIEKLNKNIKIDKFVLMPNHIHAIIIIEKSEQNKQSENLYNFQIEKDSIPGLIKDFKSVTTRKYKQIFNTNESLWQESFYDEIIENQKHYDNVWQYIEDNPVKWLTDDLNPDNFDFSKI